jgi:hypothetical protein
VRNIHAGFREPTDFQVRHVHGVHGEKRRIDKAKIVQAFEGAFAGILDGRCDFCRRFVQVYLHGDVELVRQNPKRGKRLV